MDRRRGGNLAFGQLERDPTMRNLLVSCLLFLTLPTWGQVLQEGDLSATFDLQTEGGKPIILATFFNMTDKPMSLFLPAGVTLIGKAEPCLPVALGRDIKLTLSPGEYTERKVEALSFSFHPHTAGGYEVAVPDDDSRALCLVVQKIWRRYNQGGLVGSPLRLTQLAVYVAKGATLQQVHPTFSEAEVHEAARILKEP